MKSPISLLPALLLAPQAVLHAADYFAATTGSDQAVGTLAAPLKTIQAAFNKASAGDTIILREGTYLDAVALKNKSGKDGSPITLKNFQGEKPVISGLDRLKLEWEATSQTGIYVADFSTKSVLQLFYNGKPMLEVKADKSVVQGEVWTYTTRRRAEPSAR